MTNKKHGLSTDAELVNARNEALGYVEFLNGDVSCVARKIYGRVSILMDLENKNVIGYRVYDAPATPSVAAKAAVYRIQRYIHQRSLSRSYNEDIHGFHVGDENREAILNVNDIEAVLTALSAQMQDVAGWKRLDDAFSNFVNGYGDPYEPKEAHDAETARNLKELCEAFTAFRAAITAAKQEKPA